MISSEVPSIFNDHTTSFKMFPFYDKRLDEFTNIASDSFIIINQVQINVIVNVCTVISPKLQNVYIKACPTKCKRSFTIKNLDIYCCFIEIENLFQARKVYVTRENRIPLQLFAEFFQIESLSFFISDLIFDKNIIDRYFLNNSDFINLCILEDIISSISNDSKIIEAGMICQAIIINIGAQYFLKCFFNICRSSPHINFSHIVKFIKILNNEMSDMINNIIQYCEIVFKKEKEKENAYLVMVLHKLYDENMITFNDLSKIFKNNFPFLFIDILDYNIKNIGIFSLSKIERNALENHDYKIHKRGIKEGHSQDPILYAIRQDESEIFASHHIQNSSLYSFQTIRKNEYEIIPFINDGECTLIGYAAFFGAVKCFKYFLMIEPNCISQKYLQYAIAGGNKEIIMMFLRSGVSFENTLKTAVEFHQNKLLTWIFENQFNEINDDLLSTAMINSNFKGVEYIIKEGFSLYNFFSSAVACNNSHLLKICLEILQILKKENYINIKKKYIFICIYQTIFPYVNNIPLYIYEIIIINLWSFFEY